MFRLTTGPFITTTAILALLAGFINTCYSDPEGPTWDTQENIAGADIDGMPEVQQSLNEVDEASDRFILDILKYIRELQQRLRNLAGECLEIFETKVDIAIGAVEDVAEKQILEDIVTCVSSPIPIVGNPLGILKCPNAITNGFSVLKKVLERQDELTEDVEDCIDAISPQ